MMSSSRICVMRVLVSESLQAGHGQDDRIEFAGVELAQPCIDIATKHDKIQRRESMPQLNLPPQTAGPDCRVRPQFLKLRSIGDECVPWIFTFRNGRRSNTIGQLEGHIFEAVHGKIDAAVEQRFIEFFCEQSLAADLRQRNVENLVAGGLDRNEFDRAARPAVLQFRFHPVRLPQRQRAASVPSLKLASLWFDVENLSDDFGNLGPLRVVGHFFELRDGMVQDLVDQLTCVI